MDRLVAGAAVLAAAPDREQQPLRGAGGGPGSEPGVAGARAEPPPAGAGHAGRARVPGAAGGDVRGPVALRRHLLPGVELAVAGARARLFPRTGRVGALAGERSAEGGVRVRDGEGRAGGAVLRGAAPGTGGPVPGRHRRARPSCAACMRFSRTCRTSARPAGGATAWPAT